MCSMIFNIDHSLTTFPKEGNEILDLTAGKVFLILKKYFQFVTARDTYPMHNLARKAGTEHDLL